MGDDAAAAVSYYCGTIGQCAVLHSAVSVVIRKQDPQGAVIENSFIVSKGFPIFGHVR